MRFEAIDLWQVDTRGRQGGSGAAMLTSESKRPQNGRRRHGAPLTQTVKMEGAKV